MRSLEVRAGVGVELECAHRFASIRWLMAGMSSCGTMVVMAMEDARPR